MIEINDTTLIEFLEGKLDNAATAEVERWYDASEANRRHLEQLYFVLFTGDRLSAAQAVNPEYGWQALRRRIETLDNRQRHLRIRSVMRYAAMFFIGVLLSAALLYRPEQTDDRSYLVETEEQGCTIRLADSSTVRLMPRSRLNYAADFGHRQRRVSLTGGAYFDIRKKSDAPFTVATRQGAEVIVRGTKFNMKAYHDCSDIETVLVEGKVDFHADDRTVTLEPGQKVSYNPIQKTIAVEHVNVEEELNSNQRSFQYVRLSEIARSVGEYFHCAISFRDETLGSILFTGTLDFDMPLRHILEILTISTDTRFSQTGNGVAIYR